MIELLTYVLKEITGSDKGFDISEDVSDDIHTFTVSADPDSIGLIIGKGGRTIKAIQTLLRVRARLEKVKVYVNITETGSVKKA